VYDGKALTLKLDWELAGAVTNADERMLLVLFTGRGTVGAVDRRTDADEAAVGPAEVEVELV